jgi:SAM-dependent methyltransferase
MTQITSGIRSVLSYPFIYSTLQSLMGAHKGRQKFVANYIKPFPEIKILDVGCGPAEILSYLSSVDYYGFDISKQYIEKASNNYSGRGTFFCKLFEDSDLEVLPKFDVILAMGLLHHLDDEEAVKLIELASKALKPGGRLLTVDPCFVSGQNFIARFLINNDRGLNVRNKEEYLNLVNGRFNLFNADVIHQTWIPYTNCFMTCIKE